MRDSATLAALVVAMMTGVLGGLIGIAPVRAQSVIEQLSNSDPCRIPTSLSKNDDLHIFRVRALSSRSAQGYADEGMGQGEFETVQLIEIMKSNSSWKAGRVIQVHPFPGVHRESHDRLPEHLEVGKTYFLIYPFSLQKTAIPFTPNFIGLTRCGVLDETPDNRNAVEQALKQLRTTNRRTESAFRKP